MAQKKSFLLRMDPEVWDELQAWSASEFRSVNGQIEYLLKEALRARHGKSARPAVAPLQVPVPAPESPPSAPLLP